MKKKVIFSLLDSPSFGGAEQYVFGHLRFLNRNGFNILLATNNETVKKEFLKRLRPKDRKTFVIKRLPYKLDAIGNLRGLIKFFLSLPKATIWCFLTLKRLKKDFEEVTCLWPGFSDRLVFSPIAKFFECSLIWIEIGPLHPVFERNYGFPKILYRLSERFPDALVTTSLYSMKSILRYSKISKEKVNLIYPGIKTFPKGQLAEAKKNTFTTFSVVARLAHENEVDMVIRAFSLYLKTGTKNVRLWIIGTGPQEEKLKELTRTLSLNNYVHFFGFLNEDEKIQKIRASDFFIFPRAWSWDGFGITTIEALSQGIPVLTSRFGPQIEIIRDDIEGFLYKPHDPLDLSRKMVKIVNLPKRKSSEMQKNALGRANYFSKEKSNHQILTLIRSLG